MWFPDLPPETVAPIFQHVEASAHPRLFASAEDFARLQQRVAQQGLHARMLARILTLADSLLSAPPAQRVLTGRRLLSISRLEVYRISTLALAYRMTANRAYLDRCVAELRAIASFEDWNPSHFLDVGEMTLAVATGYDWLYHELSQVDRDLIANAILHKGLLSSADDAWWHRARNNWGQVCNTGMIAGAIAIAEFAPDTCRENLHASIQALALPMEAYAPCGNYPEGPSYWNYGTGYNVLGLSILQSACHTDFGLSAAPGFQQSGFYCDLLYGPSGLPLKYSDCGSARVHRSGSRDSFGIPWWFARHFRNPAYIERSERTLLEDWCAARPPIDPARDNGWFRAYSFFWIFDSDELPASSETPPLVWNPQGPVPIAIARTSWDDPMAVYLGVKCGSPSAPHGHMDEGSFQLDAFGERWFSDLGCEGYNRIEQMGLDLWNKNQDSDRWKLFRLNNFGHNTLTLDNHLQLVSGTTSILSVSRTPQGCTTFALDLTEVYANDCSKALRTLTLESDGTLTINDHLEGLREGALVSWRAITPQAIESTEPDRIVLRGTHAKLEARTLSETPASWSIADILQPAPFFEGDSENPGVQQLRLEATAPASGIVNLRVRIKAVED